MQVLLDIEESKAMFIMEMLKKYSYVKVQPFFEKGGFSWQEFGERADDVAEVKNAPYRKNAEKDIFADVFGIWADRDIDGTTLRNQAWGIES